MTDKIKEQLHQMVAEGKTAGVVQQLLEITQYFGDDKLEKTAEGLYNDYKALEQNTEDISEEEFAAEVEKINQRVKALLDAVPAQGQAPMARRNDSTEADQSRSSWWKPALIVVIIMILLYLVLS